MQAAVINVDVHLAPAAAVTILDVRLTPAAVIDLDVRLTPKSSCNQCR